jgi:hypothetical protein
MKKSIGSFLVFLFITSFNSVPSKKLVELKIFYNDTETEKGKNTYRELTQIGEDPWAKPEKLDIVLTIDKSVISSNEKIEILIEELYKPTELNKAKETLKDKRWIPNKVVFSETGMSIRNFKLIKANKITLKDIPYQTAYYTDSMLYDKSGFRFVVIYFNEDTKQFERLVREIIIPV